MAPGGRFRSDTFQGTTVPLPRHIPNIGGGIHKDFVSHLTKPTRRETARQEASRRGVTVETWHRRATSGCRDTARIGQGALSESVRIPTVCLLRRCKLWAMSLARFTNIRRTTTMRSRAWHTCVRRGTHRWQTEPLANGTVGKRTRWGTDGDGVERDTRQTDMLRQLFCNGLAVV